jgi:hypothetical protein
VKIHSDLTADYADDTDILMEEQPGLARVDIWDCDYDYEHEKDNWTLSVER